MNKGDENINATNIEIAFEKLNIAQLQTALKIANESIVIARKNKQELIKKINEYIDNEIENVNDTEDKNCFYAGACDGAIEAYRSVIDLLGKED